MMKALGEVNYWYLIPTMVFLFLSLWFRAYRWGIFFRPIKTMRMKNLFSALMVGYMANNVLPFRLGELLRAYSIGELEGFSKVSAFATIVLERILDAIVLLILLGFALLFQPFPDYIKTSGWIMLIVSSIALIFLAFLAVRTEGTIRFYRSSTRILPKRIREKGEKIVESLLEGLVVLRQPRLYFNMAISSAAIWISYLLIVHTLVLAFDFHKHYELTIFASITILVMTGVSVSLPSSPGYIGTYHYLVMTGLAIYSVPESEALSFAILLHLFTMLPMTLVGLYYFMRQHLTLTTFSEKEHIIDNCNER